MNIDTPVDYTFNPALPISFGGVSGGGLWAFRIARNQNGDRAMTKAIFCGVAFYQCETGANKTFIRHHFGLSVYEEALRLVNGI